MKVGDLVICRRGDSLGNVGILLRDNVDGGTLKIYDAKSTTKIIWVVRSEWGVISESR